MNLSGSQSSAGRWWPLIAVVVIAAIWLYRTPYSASNLPVPPDSVEYALAPLQLLETGHYNILVQGRALPPRYPPWFPVGVLMPAYLLFGHEPGNAIIPVTFLAVAGVALAWAIGRRISSPVGGVLAALAVLFLPTFSTWATVVMSDVPATALMLAAFLLFLRLRERTHGPTWYLLAGAIVAFATLVRPVFAAMILPFAFAALTSSRPFLLRLAALVAPMAAAIAATFAYNAATFGSAGRNGYNLWTAVPVDYPRLTFSPDFIAGNLWVILNTAFPIILGICVVSYFLARWKCREALQRSGRGLADALIFSGLTAGPISLFHLFYFFPSGRFYLPLLAANAIMAGALLGVLAARAHNRVVGLLLGAVLTLVVAARFAVPEPLPLRRIAADRVRSHTPGNAVVISSIEPVYMERLAAFGSLRRIVPLSRNVEYASKLLVWKRIDHPEPPPRDWRDGHAEGLKRAGAEEAVRFVASEQIQALAAEAAAGTPLFLETSSVSPEDNNVLAALQARFSIIPRAPYLYELQPL